MITLRYFYGKSVNTMGWRIKCGAALFIHIFDVYLEKLEKDQSKHMIPNIHCQVLQCYTAERQGGYVGLPFSSVRKHTE